MMNRRQFVHAAAASALTFSRAAAAFAADYDLIIRGGRVIDPSLRLNAVRDVAITGGRIAEVSTDIAVGSADVINATGKLVVPGLLDIHTHYAREAAGPALGLSGGVTGWIDAGSAGADQLDQMAAVVRAIQILMVSFRHHLVQPIAKPLPCHQSGSVAILRP